MSVNACPKCGSSDVGFDNCSYGIGCSHCDWVGTADSFHAE